MTPDLRARVDPRSSGWSTARASPGHGAGHWFDDGQRHAPGAAVNKGENRPGFQPSHDAGSHPVRAAPSIWQDPASPNRTGQRIGGTRGAFATRRRAVAGGSVASSSVGSSRVGSSAVTRRPRTARRLIGWPIDGTRAGECHRRRYRPGGHRWRPLRRRDLCSGDRRRGREGVKQPLRQGGVYLEVGAHAYIGGGRQVHDVVVGELVGSQGAEPPGEFLHVDHLKPHLSGCC
jgi:hypothetical protein